MRIKYKTLDTNQTTTITVENTRCIATVRLPQVNATLYFGLVIWEHQRDSRKICLSDATGGYTIVARCETISAFLDKPLKPLMNRLKKELSNNTLEIDLTEENTDLNLMEALEIAHGETKK